VTSSERTQADGWDSRSFARIAFDAAGPTLPALTDQHLELFEVAFQCLLCLVVDVQLERVEVAVRVDEHVGMPHRQSMLHIASASD
jgi:hypothetical protein